MPGPSLEGANATLDALLGDHHAPNWPATVLVGLLTASGELVAGGYARQSVANDSAHWPDSTAAEKDNGQDINFGPDTDPTQWPPITGWLIAHPTTGNVWMTGVWATPLPVVAGGRGRIPAGALRITCPHS